MLGSSPRKLYSATGLESKMPVCLVCFGLYFVNYRSWQAEILQGCAEGCVQVDLQKKIYNTFLFCNFAGVLFFFGNSSHDLQCILRSPTICSQHSRKALFEEG